MKYIIIACLTCIALLTTGCGVSRQATNNQNKTQTEVVLAKKNYRVIGMVSGESSQSYWFGIGGLSMQSIGESAMSDMYKNANLKGSQAIINVNVCYKNKFILIHTQAKAIATGTIIEFFDNNMNSSSLLTNPSDSTAHESKRAAETPAIENHYSSDSSTQEHLAKTSPNEKAYYHLVYMKKGKKSKTWSVEKEETILATYDKVQVLVEKWNAKSSNSTEYKCNVKKDK